MTLHIPPDLDKGLKYYLAGPMSGLPHFNYPAFEKTATILEGLGLSIESPHRNPWPDEDVPPEELWKHMMTSALRQLLDSQGLILLRGWTASRGAVVEANIASALQMPMYFLDGGYLVAMHPLETNL